MTLKISKLTKYFDGKKIFRDFSYDFPPAGIFAIVGESGIGKTTLLRIISGLDKDYSGEVIGGGFSNVSFAFQEYRLLPTLTALDNAVLAVSDTKDGDTVKKAASIFLRLGFSKEDMLLYPSELSGGMKQRASLARAFLKAAPVLLLDEPTKELDSENASLVVDMIAEAGTERLVLLVTHRPEDIEKLSPKIINLNEKAVL